MVELFLERDFEPAITPADLVAAWMAGRGCAEIHRVAWRSSLLSLDGHKLLCHFTAPDAESLRIACRLYREIVSGHDWGFPEEPPADVMESLAAVPPRDMRKRLLAAFGTAKLDGRSELATRDLEASRGKTSRRMGF